nr:hypothetical protein [Tanacetum cinerariifolium]
QDPPSSPSKYDDQDHPPSPPKDSDRRKKKRHDSDASGSTLPPFKDSEQSSKKKQDSDASIAQQPPAQTSSAWKITNTRDAQCTWMEKRIWTEDDKRMSQDFIEAIERRLKIRRIFRSLESFVGGRLRDTDYRLITRTTSEGKTNAFTMKMEILLELTSNKLLDHIKMELEISCTSRVKFITECSNTTYNCYEVMKDQIKVSKLPQNSDIIYFFTSAQDGNIFQDDERLCLAEDLKKAQDHNKKQVIVNKLKYKQKITTPKYKISNEESKVYEMYTRSI